MLWSNMGKDCDSAPARRWRRGAVVPPAAMLAVMLATLALAGCSGGFPGFGGTKRARPAPAVDLNLFPANYRNQVAMLLRTTLTDPADFSGALIAPPVLKPVAESPNLHYVVCVQLNGHNERKTKVVIYLGGDPTQYVDATPQQCADAAYQPFTELQNVRPQK